MEKDYLIDKWLNEGLTDSEMETFRKRDDYDELVTILENAKLFKASEFSNVDNFDSLKSKMEARKKMPQGISWVKPLLRMAAVLMVGIGLFYLLFEDGITRIETMGGEKMQIELPDASAVVLNAASEISYDKDRWEEERRIELKGEAFFDVKKGSSFQVMTATGTITVLGTEFNVRQRAGHFEVHCFEGSVQVITTAHNNTLAAGDHLQLLGNRMEVLRNVRSQPGWLENTSSFNRVPLGLVIDELERQYNIKVEFSGDGADSLFTGGFVHGDLKVALQAITRPFNLDFNIQSTDTVIIFASEK
ncbi:MAG: FecR domain-containing protein [Flavobacteriaceae bacterium]